MKLIVYIQLLLLILGCKEGKKKEAYTCTQNHTESPCGAVPGKVNLRFLNATNNQICNLLYMPDTLVRGYYSSIPAHTSSCYVPYPYSYYYGYLSYDIDGNAGVSVPIDFEGEPQLQAGNYTMVLKDLGNGSTNKLYIDTLLVDP